MKRLRNAYILVVLSLVQCTEMFYFGLKECFGVELISVNCDLEQQGFHEKILSDV